MDINQFAVYQLKNIPENREIRFRPYHVLQEKNIQVRSNDYEQAYLGKMQPEDAPEIIRKRFEKQLPRTFKGHSISVSDVLVLNREGIVTSYYVEKSGFTVIAGFIRNGSSGALVSFDTTDFHIEGKEGNWLAFDSIIIDGKQFFLMEHETYGRDAAWTVVDEDGKLVVDKVQEGFNENVLQQIRDYLNSPQKEIESEKHKPPLENWQKYMENGEYLRSSEIDEEQNYNMIDGRRNNMPVKGKNGRPSVLAKLRQKQAEIARRGGKPVPQMGVMEDMERKRK